MKKNWYNEPEMIVAWSAMFISLLALLATMYEANLERENQLLSVWPRLTIQVHLSNTQGYGIEVSNKGLGPAIVKTAKIKVDGKQLHSWEGAFRELKVSGSLTVITSSLDSSIISQNEIVTAIKVEDAIGGYNVGKVNHRIGLEVCYCSVYDDCWLVNKDNQYKSVKQCMLEEKKVGVPL